MSKQETSGPAAFQPIPGYDGRYEVSRSGVVCEWTPTESTVPGTPQKLRVPLQGHVRQGASHRRYTLTDSEGNRRTLSERSLIAWAWEGEEPRRGARKGADHYATQLTEADVVSIRARLEKLGADPLVLKSIAEAFNVTPATIHAIHAGKSWTHLLGGDKADGGEEELDQLPLFGEKPAAFEPVDPDPSKVRARPPLEGWDPWPSGILIPTTLAPQRFRDELQRHLDAIPKGVKRHPIVQERPTRYCATCRHLDTNTQTCDMDGCPRRPDTPPGCSTWERKEVAPFMLHRIKGLILPGRAGVRRRMCASDRGGSGALHELEMETLAEGPGGGVRSLVIYKVDGEERARRTFDIRGYMLGALDATAQEVITWIERVNARAVAEGVDL